MDVDFLITKIIDIITGYIQKTDKFLWFCTIFASIYGLLLINSMQRAGDYNYMRSQLLAIIIGYIGAIIISVIDFDNFTRFWPIVAFISLSLTVAVFFLGIQVSGTDDTAWLMLPGGLTFQPSELTKICFIITFSAHLAYLTEKELIKTFTGTLSLVLHAAIPAVLIHLQGDDGSALIFIIMSLIMSFISGTQLRYYIIMFTGIACLTPIIWNNVLNQEHRNRILVLFNLDENYLSDYAWQQYQSKVSIASGQFKGYGLGEGPRVATEIVPEQENDFIFTVAGEELGFLGCLIILIILFLIMFKCILNCDIARNITGKYICIGFFSLLFVQTAINIAMVLGLLPVVGITLPFFSAGGTSAMCLYFGIGLVQSVYMHREDKERLTLHIDKFRR